MSDIFRKLCTELDDFARNAVVRAENVPFRRILDPYDDVISVLSPSQQQQADARGQSDEFTRWSRTVASVLRRNGSSRDLGHLTRLTAEMNALLRLERQHVAEVTERQWRRGFSTDVEQTSAALRALLTRTASGFEIVQRRVPIEYMPFEVEIVEIAADRWVVRTGNSAETISFADLQIFEVGTSLDAVVASGRALYQALWTGSVEDAYLEAVRKASDTGRGLRVELDLKRAGRLGSLPWESMHDGDQFLLMRHRSSVVRTVEARAPQQAVVPVAPLRVLLTISSPRSLPWLDSDREQQRIEAAVAPLVTLGLMELSVAPDGSMNTLHRMIASAEVAGRPFHGWHFIGHGEFDRGSESGTLAMTDEKREVHRVGGWELSVLFRNHPGFRFAILNACEGACISQRGTMFGVATSLIESRVPTVVAMQFPISDRSAIVFAESLYGALVDGSSFDDAVAEGRRAILFQLDATEWITPVTFMAGRGSSMRQEGKEEGRKRA